MKRALIIILAVLAGLLTPAAAEASPTPIGQVFTAGYEGTNYGMYPGSDMVWKAHRFKSAGGCDGSGYAVPQYTGLLIGPNKWSSIYVTGENDCTSLKITNEQGQTKSFTCVKGQTVNFPAGFNDNVKHIRYYRVYAYLGGNC